MAGNYLIRRGFRKSLSILLALTMLLGSLGIAGIAAAPIYAADPQGCVTVRIEANGFGTDGTDDNIGEVIKATIVDLDLLGDNPTALDAVNRALKMNAIDEEVAGGGLTSVGGVSAMPDTGASWMFMHNDDYSSATLENTNISAGDSIVLCLAVYDMDKGTYSTEYQYLKTVNSISDIQWGYAYAEVTLTLYNKRNIGWDEDFNIIWAISKVGNINIYNGTGQAYTPDGGMASTDLENGTATITLWGGDSAGTYHFDITAGKAGATKACCLATMVFDGINPPSVTFSQPSAADTVLKTAVAGFNGGAAGNIMPYVNGSAMIVNNAVGTVSISAAANDSNADITATYKSAGAADFTVYNFDEEAILDVGDNIFKFTVTNGADTHIHTFIVDRKQNAARNIDAEVAAVINGVKGVKGFQPVNDWILAMNGAGITASAADKEAYLAAVLTPINTFSDSGTGNIGTLAKIAIALSSMGIDVRQIPDPDDSDIPINLIDLIAGYTGTLDINNAPYLLSLYDLEDGNGNKLYPISQEAALKRSDLIAVILDTQNPGTDLFGSVDVTGLALPALAPYYRAAAGTELNGVPVNSIKDAVNDAITALSERQSIDGGFGSRNSNTTSAVVIGLAALGIDPHEDNRFIKSGSTLITDLLSFRTYDDKLGFVSNESADDYACTQGFQALAAYQNIKGSRSSNLYHFDASVGVYTNWPGAKLLTGISVTKPDKTIYDLDVGGASTVIDPAGMVVRAIYNADPGNSEIIGSGYTVSTIDATTAGTKSVKVTYEGHTATFNVAVTGGGGAIPQEKKVRITVKSSGKGTIAADNAYVIEAGVTTVMDVLIAVLSDAGKTYVIQGGYVSEIDGLSEFSQGANSGWLYYVDGVDSGKSAGIYKLKGGEVIQWIYTLDYTKESGAEKWNNTPLPGEVTGTVNKDTINAALKEIQKGSKESWTLDLAQGSIAFDKGALEGLVDQIKEDSLEVSIEPISNKDLSSKQKEAVGGRPVYDIKITVDKKSISQFKGKLTISLPYTLKEGENPSGIVIYHLNDAGELVPMEGYFDTASGKVVFTVDHLSYYVIGYDEALSKWPFSDVVQNDSINWFYSPVKYVYEKGIFSGTSTTTFAPNSPLTRSMLVSVLARLGKADQAAYKEVVFGDVDVNSWYGPSVAWAKEAGIISGYKNADGSYSFKPDANISRQDIAVMIDNYNKSVAKQVYKKAEAVTFTDNLQIYEYARASVSEMQQAGIINGIKNADGTFRYNPLSNATRAEAATMIYKLLSQQ